MRELTITLPGERPPSWNAFYSGQHWRKRKELADDIHLRVRAALDPDEPMFTRPVDITVTAYFKGRRLDPDNVAAKLYIDGLCGWLLADDTPAHVASVTTASRADRRNPRVEITLREAA